MRCPTLDELPPPPPGKTGWPWTEESEQLPDTMPDPSTGLRAGGEPWPRISIVTPSYNQAQFIEETIRSVLLQGYPNLEYIIIDGGSDDGSVEIIRKYEPWLAYWVSEKDRGQSHAINKGFERATGKIIAWLNSDDVYEPGALENAATHLKGRPDVGLVYSNCNIIDQDSRVVRHRSVGNYDPNDLLLHYFVMQPSTFIRREAYEHIGGLKTDLDYAMDYDLWLRIGRHYSFARIERTWANFRRMSGTKSVSQPECFFPEIFQILDAFFSDSMSEDSILKLKKRAYGRAYWRAGVVFRLVGKPEVSNRYLTEAVKTYQLLRQDWNFAAKYAVDRLRGELRGHQGEKSINAYAYFHQLTAALSVKKSYSRRLERHMRAKWHISEAQEKREQRGNVAMRKDLVAAFIANPGIIKEPNVAAWMVAAFLGSQWVEKLVYVKKNLING
jgi:glycosyltransferase involved in cell wall biosynthesis